MSAYIPATHIFTGSAPCGCVVAMCLDKPEYTNDVEEFRNLGYVVTRIEIAAQAWTRCAEHADLDDAAWLVAIDARLHAARTKGSPCFEDAALASIELSDLRTRLARVEAENKRLREALKCLGNAGYRITFEDKERIRAALKEGS